MQPKPRQWSQQHASAFQESSVVAAYQHRPGYPEEVLAFLARLAGDTPRRVLDVGCGTGFLARPLTQLVEHVDAVDISVPMIAEGQRLPHGDAPNLRWIVGRAEDAPLDPPYSMITAGESFHWLDWDIALPRFARMLTPNGYLAIIELGQLLLPWDAALASLIRRYSTNQEYQPLNLIAELERRGLFTPIGRHRTRPVAIRQPVDTYIESFHGRASFSRQRMSPEAAAAFDQAVREVLAQEQHTLVELRIIAEIVWGKPQVRTSML
ncbi:MAG TPA: methyltransferase domain-containing protein [Herpetosiphonaceae bacterium]